MRFLSKCPDGGPDSPVTAYFLIEIKSMFSIVLSHFGGTRENFHSHAFNALTFWLRGSAIEYLLEGKTKVWKAGQLKYTKRNCFHKVEPIGNTWALSLRGPWIGEWQEYSPKVEEFTTLTHGRKIKRRIRTKS